MEATQPTSGNDRVPQSHEAVIFRPGEIIGVYRILSLIGKGGMGEVFKVEHTLTKRIEAIKTLSADRSQEAQRFLREVQIHASLSHPNIASVHNAFWAGEDLVMAMEFVEGQPLRLILEQGRISPALAIDYVCQALSALTYAHARRVTHRDITPGNMLVTSRGTIKLTDFGLAKLPSDLRLTKTGMMVGSLYYMSPEQVRAIPDIDPRSDLYSVGAVLYEMVTGVKPFDGDSAFAIMLAQVGQDPRAPISLEPALPPGLNEVILRALAKDPGDRFQSAEEFRLALESFRETEPVGSLVSLDNPRLDLEDAANGASGPVRALRPEPAVSKWRSFAIAASFLAIFGSVFASRTWPRIRLTPTMSAPVRATPRVPPQTTMPVATSVVAALPQSVSQPPMAALASNRSDGDHSLKKPGFTNLLKERVPLATGKPQTINYALIPTVASAALIEAPAPETSLGTARTGIVSANGVLDVLSGTEPDFRPDEGPTAPGNEQVAPEAPGSETVATASFEPLGPSRIHKVLSRISPARVVHPHEKVGFLPAKPIRAITPGAPLRLMRGARGPVLADVRVTIDKGGKVTSVNLEPPTQNGPLPGAAMTAAWTWTFTPARKGSNPVESQAILHFRFQNPEFVSANR